MQQDELEMILAPISQEVPAGNDLRFEEAYDCIQEARREDDASLAQGIWQTTLKRADWDTVERTALDVLQNRSKDLQVAIWLLEARVSLYGYAGFRSGMRVINALCDAYWEDLYPQPDDGDLEHRFSPIEWMNERLGPRIKSIAITRPTSEDHSRYSWADLELARRLENAARKDPSVLQQKNPESRVTMAQFDASTMHTPDPFFISLQEDLAGCMAEIDGFIALLRGRCGNNAPSLAKLRAVLSSVSDHATMVMRMRQGDSGEPEFPASGPLTDAAADGGTSAIADEPSAVPADEAMPPPARNPGDLRSRHDAYAMLSTIADYLMKIEPHSPTPYLIRRAVRWGNMSLTALLQELMEEGGSLSDIYRLLGIGEREP